MPATTVGRDAASCPDFGLWLLEEMKTNNAAKVAISTKIWKANTLGVSWGNRNPRQAKSGVDKIKYNPKRTTLRIGLAQWFI